MLTKATSPAAMAYLASQQMKGAAPAAGEFSDMLGSLMASASTHAQKTDALVAQAAMGGKTDVVDVVTAVAESEAAIEMLVAVRDKVVQAYEDIMRMPI